LEREADAMADKVMRMSMPEPIGFSSAKNSIQRKCAHCEEEEKKEQLQRKESNSEGASVAPSIVSDVLNSSSGKSLDNDSRSFMESRFNYDFSSVKIHDDDLAAKSAGSINALAYTSGNNIVFNSGQYNTTSDSGKRLLAHELTHVVQQNGPNIRRQEDVASSESTASANRPARFIVEDDVEPGEGQMRKSDFLERLNIEICSTVNDTMRGTRFSADNCPYIRSAFARHRNSNPTQLEQLIERYAPGTASAHSIDDLIEIMKARVAAAATQWVENGGNLSEFSEEANSLVPAGSSGESGEKVQLKSNDGGGRASQAPGAIMRSLGKGNPIDGNTRNKMESAFGASFSDVQLHTDSNAAAMSSKMNARAFTVGNHIAFSTGEHKPGSLVGDALMAHELAHVLQQKSAVADSIQSNNTSSYNQLEEDADLSTAHVLSSMLTGKTDDQSSPRLSSGLKIHRCQAAPLALVFTLETAEVGTVAVVAGETTVTLVEGAAVVEGGTALAAPATVTLAAGETLVPASVAAPAVVSVPAAAVAAPTVSTTAATLTIAAVSATTLSSDSPQTSSSEEEEEEQRRCRNQPCASLLPISWPTELPNPEGISPRTLMRVSRDDLEWEGIERGAAQRLFAQELRNYRDNNLELPPGVACFEDEAEPNTPFDAHHIHPMYLNGEDAQWNLCAVETLRHLRGHARLDFQPEHLPEYEACGICEARLSRHPMGQQYMIVAEK
jgi:Domain of unknown function (DUF4157)